MKQSARQAALTMLLRVEQDAAYSNLTLDHILSEGTLSPRDKRFASQLFYGVLEQKLLLDYNLAVLSDRPPHRIDSRVMVILRMGLYQLFCMDSVPAAAAVNESVRLCRENGLESACGFVNGLLRAAARLPEPRLPDRRKGKNKYLSVKYSCPEPIVRLWRQGYGDEAAEGLLASLIGRPPLCVRVNTLKTTAPKLKAALEQQGLGVEYSTLLEDCLLLTHTGAVEELPQFREGLFHVQDSASQLCCQLLQVQPGQTVLDACAAPGGKSFTLAQRMQNQGKIVACDLYRSRLQLVEAGAKRLSVNILSTVEEDASKLTLSLEADRVLCDVPCSGLGIIRRKPELRYKQELGLTGLPALQYAILCRASAFVKSGGLLVYSTCTLHPAENNENIRRFLSEHEEFAPEPLPLPEGFKRGVEEHSNELTLLPQVHHTDGFFISLIRRK